MAKNTIQVSVLGVANLAKRFADLQVDGQRRVNRAINVNALEFQREVRKSIRKRTGTYRTYKRGETAVANGKKRIHYSSMPGSPPNSDTGNLVRKIMVTKSPSLLRPFAVIVSGAKYSAALERAKPPREARPFMGPVLREKRKVFASRVEKAITGLL